MKHLAGAAFLAAVAASLTFAAAGVPATSGAGGTATPVAAKAKLPALPSYVKSRHKWVIGVKCDFPPFGYIDYTGRACRLRRGDRSPLRAARVRQQVQGQAHVRDDAEPHSGAAVVAGGHHHLDAHVDAGAERRHRLLDAVLLGDGTVARAQQHADQLGEGPRREDRRHDTRVDLLDLDAQLLQEQQRCSRSTGRRPR